MPDSTRRSTVTTYPLVVLMLYGLMSANGQTQSPSSTPPTRQDPDGWDQLVDLPRRSKVRIAFTDGSEVEGRLVEARGDAVVLEANEIRKGRIVKTAGERLEDGLTFHRAGIARVSLVQTVTTYRAVGAVDALAVRKVVRALEKDQKIELRVSSGQTVTGRIIETHDDGMVLARGRRSPIRIAYRDVNELKPARMPNWQKALIAVGLGYAAIGVMAIFMLS